MMKQMLILILLSLYSVIFVQGLDYLTSPVKNQYLPQSCGSCWAHSITSELTDKINRKLMANNSFPIPQLSIQYLVDCYPSASCSGSFYVHDIYKWLQQNSIPDETQYIPYKAFTNKTCQKNMVQGDTFKIQRYKILKGYDHIKHELKKNPPISCMVQIGIDEPHLSVPIIEGDLCKGDKAIHTSEPPRLYDVPNPPKIFLMGPNQNTMYKHVASVLSIVEKNGKEYYLLKNSYGSAWGDKGYQLIETKTNCLLIESYCLSAVI